MIPIYISLSKTHYLLLKPFFLSLFPYFPSHSPIKPMKIHNRKLIKARESKWRKMDNNIALPQPTNCDELVCCPWLCGLWSCLWKLNNKIGKNDYIPKDVPKGHMVVYVGQDLKRHIIKITLLKHPLVGGLLDQAQDEYGFAAASKLCIPCDEGMFLDVIRCASSPQGRRIKFCL